MEALCRFGSLLTRFLFGGMFGWREEERPLSRRFGDWVRRAFRFSLRPIMARSPRSPDDICRVNAEFPEYSAILGRRPSRKWLYASQWAEATGLMSLKTGGFFIFSWFVWFLYFKGVIWGAFFVWATWSQSQLNQQRKWIVDIIRMVKYSQTKTILWLFLERSYISSVWTLGVCVCVCASIFGWFVLYSCRSHCHNRS